MRRSSVSLRGTTRCLRLLLTSMLVSIGLLCTTVSSASAVPADFWGMMWSGGGLEQQAGEMDVIQHSGAKVLRHEISGCVIASRQITNPGEAWKPYEDVFRLAWERGISVLPYLYGNPNCVSGKAAHQFPAEGEWKPAGNVWETFVYEAVQRFGYAGTFWAGKTSPRPVGVWEVWNEPNLAKNNPGGAGVFPNAFGKFLIRTSEALHAAEKGGNPMVALGGPVTAKNDLVNTPPTSMSVKVFLEGVHAVAGVSSAYDVLSLHPYAFTGANGAAPVNPEQVAQVRNKVKGNIEEGRNAPGVGGKPIWITELGWPIVGDAAHPGVSTAIQAQLLTSTFDMIEAEASNLGIDRLFYYNIRDIGPNTWDYTCGLRDVNGTYRPSWFAYQQQTGAAPWPLPSVSTGDPNVIQEKAANLTGTVNPNGVQTSYRFEIGTTTGYGQSVPVPNVSAGGGVSAVPVTAWVPGLEPSTVYHYRLAATNVNGTSYGNDKSFETPRPSMVVPSPSPGGWNGVIWRATDGNIFETHANSGNWESYSPTWSKQGVPSGVTAVGNPVAAPAGTGWDGIIWHGSDGNIYETHAPGGVWQSYSPTWSKQGIPPGVTVIGDPAVAPSGTGWDGIIWHGSDGHIYVTHAPGGEWQSYSPTWSRNGIPSGVMPVGTPVPSPSPGGWDGIIWRGTDGNIYETHADSGNWESYALTWSKQGIPPGVKAASDPVVAPSGSGWSGVIWRGTDGNIYETHAPGGVWQSYSPTWSKAGVPSGVKAVGNPAVAPSTGGWDGIIWRGTDGNIYETHAPGGVWQSYSPTWSRKGIPSGVTIAGDPTPSPSGSGWSGVLWRGSDGNVYETHAPGGVWQSYSPTWSKKGVPSGVSMSVNIGP